MHEESNRENSIPPTAGGIQPGTQLFERLPADLWAALTATPLGSRTGAGRLSRRVKLAFDPRGLLTPGILGEK